MQFKVPQNIDLEDKIVGPLTLIQFIYVLSGSLLIYILFQMIGYDYFAVFLVLAIPIALITLGLAFLKIQEQPLSHFITAGLAYLTQPKIRTWKREEAPIILIAPPEKIEVVNIAPKKTLEKSELDKLAYALDTQAPGVGDTKHVGQITRVFEKLLQEDQIVKK